MHNLQEYNAKRAASKSARIARKDDLAASSLGVMLQSSAQVLGFVAAHRAKAAQAIDKAARAYRLNWARQWLDSARKERIARQA